MSWSFDITHTPLNIRCQTDNWSTRLRKMDVSVPSITMPLLTVVSPTLTYPWSNSCHIVLQSFMCLSLPFPQLLKTKIMCYWLLQSQSILKCSYLSCSPFEGSAALVDHFCVPQCSVLGSILFSIYTPLGRFHLLLWTKVLSILWWYLISDSDWDLDPSLTVYRTCLLIRELNIFPADPIISLTTPKPDIWESFILLPIHYPQWPICY